MRSWVVALLLVGCFGEDDIRVVADTEPDPVFQGTVSVEPAELVLAGAVPGERAVGTVVVRNTGEYDLDLISAALTEDADGALVTDEQTNSDRVIGPGRNFDVLVRCTLPVGDSDDTDAGPASAQGQLRVRTRDEQTPVVDVPVRCTEAEG